MLRVLVRALPLLLAVAAAPAGMAEEPPPGKVPLHLASSLGKPVLFVLKSRRLESNALQDRIIQALQEPEDKYAAKRTTEFSIEVQEPRPDGTWNAFLRFGRVEATLPNPDGNPRRWTSDGSLPGDLLARMAAGAFVELAEVIIEASSGPVDEARERIVIGSSGVEGGLVTGASGWELGLLLGTPFGPAGTIIAACILGFAGGELGSKSGRWIATKILHRDGEPQGPAHRTVQP